MDLFQIKIYSNPLSYLFVIKAIKSFLNNNDLPIKLEHPVQLLTKPNIRLVKNILINSPLKKHEAAQICKQMSEFITNYNPYHPSSQDIQIEFFDIKSTKEFLQEKPPFFKSIRYLILIPILSFLIGSLIANIQTVDTLSLNDHRIELLIPTTPIHFQQGLANISQIPANTGMLFDFQKTTQTKFWMKNMQFALDLVYLDQDNRILEIKEVLPPCPLQGSCPKISATTSFQKVLELQAGSIQKLQLKVGDQFTQSKTLRL